MKKALDQNTIQVIKNLLPVLGNGKIRDKIVKTFYNILLNEKYPEFKKIFNTSNQSSGKQISALSNALLRFFSKIESIDEEQIVEMLESVMIKHVSLGVKDVDYPVVGECLVDAIEEIIIPKISEKQIAAIKEAYRYLSDVFIKEEAKIYETIGNEELGGWKGEREFIVTKIEKESEDGKIKSFYLKPKDGRKTLSFKAGDHITVSANNQLRQYSLSKYNKETNSSEYRITVKREEKGCVSTYLHGLKEGETVKIRPPVGIFHLKKEHIEGKLPIILLSSGNGLTPVLSMLHKLSQKKYKGKVYYIHCTRNQETHAMEKEVKDMANENIKIFNFYSREEKKEAFDEYIMQRINKGSLQEILKGEKIADCRFYCCGSERWFIGQEEGNGKECGVKDLLTDMEVREDQIFTENFGPSFAIVAQSGIDVKRNPLMNLVMEQCDHKPCKNSSLTHVNVKQLAAQFESYGKNS